MKKYFLYITIVILPIFSIITATMAISGLMYICTLGPNQKINLISIIAIIITLYAVLCWSLRQLLPLLVSIYGKKALPAKELDNVYHALENAYNTFHNGSYPLNRTGYTHFLRKEDVQIIKSIKGYAKHPTTENQIDLAQKILYNESLIIKYFLDDHFTFEKEYQALMKEYNQCDLFTSLRDMLIERNTIQQDVIISKITSYINNEVMHKYADNGKTHKAKHMAVIIAAVAIQKTHIKESIDTKDFLSIITELYNIKHTKSLYNGVNRVYNHTTNAQTKQINDAIKKIS